MTTNSIPEVWQCGYSLTSYRRGLGSIAGQAEYVVGKVAVTQVLSAYISFPYQLSFYQLFHTIRRCYCTIGH
jgi:hypothetical protein